MDMLYRAYSNPMDLMAIYINQGRFGKFVTGFLEAEYERKKEQIERDEDWRLWTMFIHNESDQSFNQWKKSVLPAAGSKKNVGRDAELNDQGIQKIISGLFPGKQAK